MLGMFTPEFTVVPNIQSTGFSIRNGRSIGITFYANANKQIRTMARYERYWIYCKIKT